MRHTTAVRNIAHGNIESLYRLSRRGYNEDALREAGRTMCNRHHTTYGQEVENWLYEDDSLLYNVIMNRHDLERIIDIITS